MPRLHDVVRTGTVPRYPTLMRTGTVLRYLLRAKVARARPRQVMSLSNGAAFKHPNAPGLHNVVRTGTVLRYPTLVRTGTVLRYL